MSGNSIGLVFWLLALLAVVSAVGAVTLKKTVQVFLSLVLNLLAATGLLWFLGFSGFAFVCLAVATVAAAVFYLVISHKKDVIVLISQFETHPRGGWYFIAALLIFASCLLLISNTKVWQYAEAERTDSLGELISTLLANYSLLMIFAAVFLMLLSLIMLTKPKSEKN